MNILIKNGRIIDPFNNLDRVATILVEDGKISFIGHDHDIGQAGGGGKVIDASGKWVLPAFIDLHCHIREPGFAYKERMSDTLAAAASGGYSSICVMPNLEPPIDQMPAVEHIRVMAERVGLVDMHVVGSVTSGRNGRALSQMGELKEAGVVALSDDGSTVMDSRLMMMAMLYAKSFDLALVSHCEDHSLTDKGSVNLGIVSTEMGLKGMSNASEDIITSRDIILSELTGTRLHIAHLSTEFGVELVRLAKKRGLQVTAEVTPHHFTLIENSVMGFNSNAKMNPPLRRQKDVDAVKAGLADGTIDAIATDHAPHAVQEKEREFDLAPFGIVGLETALPLGLRLVNEGLLSEMELVGKFTSGPAEVLPLGRAGIALNNSADLTIVDPDMEWCFNKETMVGSAVNSPFFNQRLKGRAVLTLNKGRIIWELSADYLGFL